MKREKKKAGGANL